MPEGQPLLGQQNGSARTMPHLRSEDIPDAMARRALHAFMDSRETSIIGVIRDAVAGALNHLIDDSEAMHRLRRETLAGPPHGTSFDDEQRRDHARGGLIAAVVGEAAGQDGGAS